MRTRFADSARAPVPLARPAVHEDDIRAVERCLRAADVGMGSERARLEARLAQLTGRAHALALNSCASALELSLLAVLRLSNTPDAAESGMRRASDGRQVLVPAAGSPSVARAVVRAGAELVPVDLDADSWTMDPHAFERARTPHTLAVVSVDLHGVVTDTRGAPAAARAAGIWLINDAAASLGAFDEHGRAGAGYGDVAVLSFHAQQTVTALEGGAVLYDMEPLARCSRALVESDERDETGRHESAYPADAPAFTRLSDLGAAVALSQLERLHAQVSERRLLVRGYHERLDGLRARGLLSFQEVPVDARPSWTRFVILLAANLPRGVDRESVRRTLASRAIASAPAAFAVHRTPGFAHLPGVTGRGFPVAQALHERGLSLPLFSGMRSAELDRVCDALGEALS